MSRGNILFFKNSCENEAKSNYSIYGATCCGFSLGLQQSLVVEFFSPFGRGTLCRRTPSAKMSRSCRDLRFVPERIRRLPIPFIFIPCYAF